ncbi:hypothetical protein E2C01_039627 [Portunus trituberculatus]|uniref:Uncharacterized protein n=1 Tax=Portunus trituberculatus TaxID=210409 RepID=A0A5B7FF80_PORTR|nr:hypothetical protein [Portunus trituberculatus]
MAPYVRELATGLIIVALFDREETTLCCKSGWRLAFCGTTIRAELFHAQGRSPSHRMVLEESWVIPSRLPKPHIHHGPSPADQDILRQGAQGYHQPMHAESQGENPHVLLLCEIPEGEASLTADMMSRYPMLRGKPD